MSAGGGGKVLVAEPLSETGLAVLARAGLVADVKTGLSRAGLLAAVGWRRRRIVAMVLVESVLISVAGALAGIVLGVAAVLTMQAMEFMRGKIEAAFSPGLFLAALVLAAGLGIAGALYPAWKAASIQPRKALL